MRLQRLLLTVIAVAVVALFASLGSWQLRRAALKEAQLAALAQARAAPVAELASLVSGAAAADLPVQVRAGTGRWLQLPPILLDNQVRERRNGVSVLRLFEAAPGAPLVLVDQGWRAWDSGRTLPPLGHANAPSDAPLEGVLVEWPGQPLALAPLPAWQDRERPWLLPRIEREAIASAVGRPLLDGLLRQQGDSGDGLRRSDPQAGALAMPPSRHRGYAVQWFALALAVVVIHAVLSWRQRQR